MQRKFLLPVIGLVAVLVGTVWVLRRDHGAGHYTGFVEGEERILRSEVAARILEVRFAEGASVRPSEPVAVLDDRDVAARLKSKQREIDVIDADLRTQEERIGLVENTWKRDLNARQADLRQGEAGTDLAEKTYARERALAETGASTGQLLDEARSRRDQSQSGLERTRQMLARTQAEERTIDLARHELAALREKRELALAQLAELEVLRSKYVIRAPATATVVQTQFAWPGELAQPGTAILSVLDPADKYVQVYVPVADVGRLRIGQRVEIDLDSRPGERIPGEISFIADKANFTPEKIETRSDRLGQVYRAKVRILERAETLQPGTEGNVYLVDGPRRSDPQTAAE